MPFADLSLILSGPNERVFMTLDEYRTLVAEAAKKPPTLAPQATVVLDADYRSADPGQPGNHPRSVEDRGT